MWFEGASFTADARVARTTRCVGRGRCRELLLQVCELGGEEREKQRGLCGRLESLMPFSGVRSWGSEQSHTVRGERYQR